MLTLYTWDTSVNVFLAVALPNSSTKSRKLVAITSSNNETQFPRFPCNYLVEQKATVAGFYCLIMQQQATIPLSTSLTSLAVYFHLYSISFLTVSEIYSPTFSPCCVSLTNIQRYRYYPSNKSPFSNIIQSIFFQTLFFFFFSSLGNNYRWIKAAIVSTKKEISSKRWMKLFLISKTDSLWLFNKLIN